MHKKLMKILCILPIDFFLKLCYTIFVSEGCNPSRAEARGVTERGTGTHGQTDRLKAKVSSEAGNPSEPAPHKPQKS